MPKCDCEEPPGGSVTCPEGHIPVCRVVNGAAQGSCWPIPTSVSGLDLTASFFSELLQREVTVGEVISRLDLQAAITDGRLVVPETGETFTFLIPESIITIVRNIVQNPDLLLQGEEA